MINEYYLPLLMALFVLRFLFNLQKIFWKQKLISYRQFNLTTYVTKQPNCSQLPK